MSRALADIERSLIKKFRKELWRPFVRAVKEYELIVPGDSIAVCISGGKDSLLLAKLLQELHTHGNQNFSLQYIAQTLAVSALALIQKPAFSGFIERAVFVATAVPQAAAHHLPPAYPLLIGILLILYAASLATLSAPQHLSGGYLATAVYTAAVLQANPRCIHSGKSRK
jgi:hypothetical protein